MPAKGFRIIKSEEIGVRNKQGQDEYIIANDLKSTYVYYPFEGYPDLYLSFAQIKAGPKTGVDNLIKFMNEYGFLGIDKLIRSGPGGNSMISGEPVSELYKEIRDLNIAVGIWKFISNKEAANLKKILQWKDESLTYKYQNGNYIEWVLIASPRHNPEYLKIIDKNNFVSAARLIILHKVNKKLSKHTDTKLFIDHKGKAFQKIYITPKNLLGVIWIQFALSISSNIKIGECCNPECNHWITEQKDYCSNACKQKAYRIRNKQKSNRGKKS